MALQFFLYTIALNKFFSKFFAAKSDEATEEDNSSKTERMPPDTSLKRKKIIEANELQRKVKDMMEKQKVDQRLHKFRYVKEKVMEMAGNGSEMVDVKEEKRRMSFL